MGRPGAELLAPTLAGGAPCPKASKLLGAPGLGFDAERRTGGAQGTYARQVATGAQLNTGFLAVGIEGCARAKEGDAKFGREAPQGGPVGCTLVALRVHRRASRAAIKNATGGPGEQAAELGVPHHPASGAVPVVAFAQRVGGAAAPNVVVQALQRQRHQHRAAMTVHDRLGQAGGAARVDNPQRVIEL